MLWVGSMLIAGHFLQAWILKQWGFDLKEHLEVIVIGIVLITTAPVIWKVVTHKKTEDEQKRLKEELGVATKSEVIPENDHDNPTNTEEEITSK